MKFPQTGAVNIECPYCKARIHAELSVSLEPTKRIVECLEHYRVNSAGTTEDKLQGCGKTFVMQYRYGPVDVVKTRLEQS